MLIHSWKGKKGFIESFKMILKLVDLEGEKNKIKYTIPTSQGQWNFIDLAQLLSKNC